MSEIVLEILSQVPGHHMPWTPLEDKIVLQCYKDNSDNSIEDFLKDVKAKTGGLRETSAYYVRLCKLVKGKRAVKNGLYLLLCEHNRLNKGKKRGAAARATVAEQTPVSTPTPVSAPAVLPTTQAAHAPLVIPPKKVGGFGPFTPSARKGQLWNVQDAAYTFHATYPEMWDAINSGRLPTVRGITKSSDEAKDPNFGINIPIISEDVILRVYSQEAKGASSFQEALTKAQPELAAIKVKHPPVRPTVNAASAPVPAKVPPAAPVPVTTFEGGVVFPDAVTTVVPPAPAPEPVQTTPSVPVRIAGKYNPDFLRETLAAIARREVSLVEGLVYLKPTRMQEIALRTLASGGMTTDEAYEIFSVTPPT